ncbi:YeeE/YedE family protein [Spirosoma utsteinense]|uniref:YeeE/YedE family protein n=1 Tax=Spirosoma utsteinense TaxID=2585773 RepID=A0ABR6W1X7_9BACT|nr:YeeE/YedE thiosulfate transporter family protein [Spirosoma utsteinense]MBC3783736.1 hypothetical protein [Spirosoma utsteinense]MBC3790121.1 hypothetical protein [Spirosoma utsteinense]
MLNVLTQPWPWYVAGALIGLTVPTLLILGNKAFGISSSLRHICAACLPGNIDFFNYDWRKEAWNLWFVGGITLGGFIAGTLLKNPEPLVIAPNTVHALRELGVRDFSSGLMPADIFNWGNLVTTTGLLFFVIGGFLVGFGTRWAGGCTSGHAIMGLSNLQWPSLVATICFMVGGIAMTHIGLPFLMRLITL